MVDEKSLAVRFRQQATKKIPIATTGEGLIFKSSLTY